MNDFLRKSLASTILIAVTFPASPLTAQENSQARQLDADRAAAPNIVLIIGDDQAWSDFGFMDHPTIRTPRLDKLASQSLTFTRGYVPCSLCSPSLASIITGLYPRQHGIVGNDPVMRVKGIGGGDPQTRARLRQHPEIRQQRYDWLQKIDQTVCLPEILKEHANYMSFQSGKWWLGNYRNGGFTHGMTHGDPERGGRHGDAGLKIGREGIEPIRQFLDVTQDSGRPFLLYYAPMMPHTPHNPPPRLLDYYKTQTPHLAVAKYQAMCEWFDESVGEVLDELEQRELDDNTIVIFVSDNGWINRTDASAYAPRSKRSPYDGGLRTPIMIRWPGKVAPQMDHQRLANSLDIVPTVLAASGIKVMTDYPGINLLDPAAVSKRNTIFGEVYDHDVDVPNPQNGLRYRWVIDGNWKLIVPNNSNGRLAPRLLFDLHSDALETRNVIRENAETVEKLRRELDEILSPEPPVQSEEKHSEAKRSDGENSTQQPSDEIAVQKIDATPNIIFFLADDQRNDALSCAGNPVLQTPSIDNLAARGIRFENAFVTTSICAASRASILTGLWERSHQSTFGTPPLNEQLVAESYPARLRDSGYRTGFVGKFGVKIPDRGSDQMFDSFKPLNQPYWKAQSRKVQSRKPQPDDTRKHLTDMSGDLAIEFLNECTADEPFCLSVWFNAGHAADTDKVDHYPWPPDEDGFYNDVVIASPKIPTDYWKSLPDYFHNSMNRQRYFWRWDTPEKYQRNMKAYYRLLTGMDRNIGRVIRHLRRQKLDTNTVIIFSSDNGYYQGSRGFAGKWSHFDESLRIPLIVFDPRSAAANRGLVRSEIVLNVDVTATILDLANSLPAWPENNNHGRSLVPLLSSNPPDDWRSEFLCEHLFDNPDIPKWEGVRSDRYKYARYFEQATDSEFLYDLKTDPDELTNLVSSASHETVLRELRQRCDALIKLNEQARVENR